MDRLKNLQIKKLINELNFLEINYKDISDIMVEADNEFIENLNLILDKNPSIKDLYNKKLEETLNINIKDNDININIIDDTINNSNKLNSESYIKLRKLYRDIVKLTHPDKSNSDEFSSIYIEATNHYNNNDLIELYKICDNLNIKYDIDENYENLLKNKILYFKDKIKFMESTFTWNWISCVDEYEKNKIIIDFINHKIN